MPASTSQRRTKPKVRRNSDVIDIFNEFSFVLPSFVIENVFLLNAVLNKPE